MSHASVTSLVPHSARITETAPARPLLVVETLDHSAGSATLFTYTYGVEAAATGAAQLTSCAQSAPADTTQFTFCAETTPAYTTQFTFCAETTPAYTAQFTFCAETTPAYTAQFTFCAETTPTGALGARTAALVAVEGDAVGGSWI